MHERRWKYSFEIICYLANACLVCGVINIQFIATHWPPTREDSWEGPVFTRPTFKVSNLVPPFSSPKLAKEPPFLHVSEEPLPPVVMLISQIVFDVQYVLVRSSKWFQ